MPAAERAKTKNAVSVTIELVLLVTLNDIADDFTLSAVRGRSYGSRPQFFDAKDRVVRPMDRTIFWKAAANGTKMPARNFAVPAGIFCFKEVFSPIYTSNNRSRGKSRSLTRARVGRRIRDIRRSGSTSAAR